MKLKFRIDEKSLIHARFTVFQDGGNCGSLTMNMTPFNILKSILIRESDESTRIGDNFFLFEIEGD